MQALIILLLLMIVGSLGHAFASMSSGPSGSARMAQALTVRISLSVGLFALLIAGHHFGWIVPHHVH